MRGHHVYKDFSEFPYSPERIFAKIVMPRDPAEYSEGHCRLIWMVTRPLLLFQSGEQPAYTALLAALLEAEGSVLEFQAFWIWKPLEISIKLQNAFVLQR